MIGRLTAFATTVRDDPRVRIVALTAYYVAILAAVLVLATHDAFTTPSFVYQGF